MYYNPMQSRLEQLNQQKQMIEQQMQMLQNYQMPPININNQITPNQPNGQAINYDFGCKWVNDEIEANNLPTNVIGFFRNEPIFTMGGKKFKFEEIINEQTFQNPSDDRYMRLEKRLDDITNILNKLDSNNLYQKPYGDKKIDYKKNRENISVNTNE